jgi:protein-S-isoprenylcysteine O-methyltransferase Ste14
MRHPMYVGVILLACGVAGVSQDATRLLFAIALAVILNAKAEFEESSLTEVFGDEYREYKSKVKRFWIL